MDTSSTKLTYGTETDISLTKESYKDAYIPNEFTGDRVGGNVGEEVEVSRVGDIVTEDTFAICSSRFDKVVVVLLFVTATAADTEITTRTRIPATIKIMAFFVNTNFLCSTGAAVYWGGGGITVVVLLTVT
jgi:hypothetical protein